MVPLTIFLLVSLTGNSLGVKHDNNQVVFSHHGRATREAAYSHMIAPLPIKELEARCKRPVRSLRYHSGGIWLGKVSVQQKVRHRTNNGEDTDDHILKQGYSAAPNPDGQQQHHLLGIKGIAKEQESNSQCHIGIGSLWTFPLHANPTEPDILDPRPHQQDPG